MERNKTKQDQFRELSGLTAFNVIESFLYILSSPNAVYKWRRYQIKLLLMRKRALVQTAAVRCTIEDHK